MNLIQLPIDPDSLYQTITFNAGTEKEVLRLRAELRHLTYTDKWYLSVFDAQTGDPYCLYVPVVTSKVEVNDLTEIFEYKGFGHFMCGAIIDNPSSEDPTEDNISEFTIVWGDTFDE